jgi:hypothetical protein
MAKPQKDRHEEKKPRKPRRSKWANDLKDRVPGGKNMTDDQLELWIIHILRIPR